MAWTDGLRPASFRGIPFFVEGSQYTGGRRVSFHEFPNREDPYAEDMGRVGRTFKIDGHLLGDDVFEQKEKLIEACEKFGPGELVHPYFGNRQVQVGAFSIDEDTKEGRILRFSIQFYEAGDNRFPKDVDDKQTLLENAADNASEKNKSLFDRAFSIAKLPGFAVNSARNSVFAAATAFQNATRDVVATAEGIANLAYDIRNLKAEVDDLLAAPDRLSQRLKDSLALLEGAISTPKGKLQAYSGLIGFVAGNTTLDTTPTRQREKSNDQVFNGFIQREAIIGAVRASSETEFESTEEAVATRTALRDAIETQLVNTQDDDVFQAFEDLQAQLVRTVPDVDSDLPNVQEVSLENSTNSLSLSYDLFENFESEADLIARNKIKNPAFIQGGKTLEVINERTRS